MTIMEHSGIETQKAVVYEYQAGHQGSSIVLASHHFVLSMSQVSCSDSEASSQAYHQSYVLMTFLPPSSSKLLKVLRP